MKKFFSFLINKHQDILRYLLIVLTVVLIINWYPITGKFKYEFEKGKPWKYETYIAPFHFAIKKSDESIKKEKELILEGFVPYYNIETAVFERSIIAYEETFKKKYRALRNDSSFLSKQKPTFKSRDFQKDSIRDFMTGKNIITYIYKKGIIETSSSQDQLHDTKVVNLLNKNIVNKIKVSEYFSIADVYKFILDTLKNTTTACIIPIIDNVISPNILYNDSITKLLKEEEIRNVSLTRGLVQEGEMVIAKGAIVGDEKYQILTSLKEEYEKRIGGIQKGHLITFGYAIVTIIILMLLTIFLYFFAKEVFFSIRKLTFLLLLIVLTTLLVSVATKENIFSLYAIPFCAVPIIVRTFFGSRLALFVHLSVISISGFIVSLGFNYPFLHLVAGIVAIFTNVQAYYWSKFIKSGAFILVTYCVTFLGISLTQEGSFSTIEWANLGWLSLNSLITMLAYLLIPLFERIFGFVSNITLTELADTNKPLLKQLSLQAPGTFNHSLQVANLSEAAAYEIGANTILVRVGSLYHDIGKMKDPLYFIENQSNEINPHDELPFEESAQFIINHVHYGIETGKKYNLPDLVIDFIRTHHGTSRVEYFYQSFCNNFPEKNIDEQAFTYPGPLPYSKETAIIMMADSVEAASRSVTNLTLESIEQLVEQIINNQIEQNQFINCSITFKEISTIKRIFKKMLTSIYHVRISYPDSK